MITNIITILISIWVLMAVLDLPPFKGQQKSFIRIIGKKVWLVTFTILIVLSAIDLIGQLFG